MRQIRWFLLVFILTPLLLVACRATAPSPTATISSSSSASRSPAAVQTATQNAGGVEWQKVVDAAKKEGEVTLYTMFVVGDPAKAVAQAFEQKYGIKIGLVSGVGAGLIERIRSEGAAGKHVADTLDTSLSLVGTAKVAGLTQSWGNLPVVAEQGIWRQQPVMDSEGHIISAAIAHMTTYVNTTLVKPADEPKKAKDLLDTKWAGQIAAGSPVTAPNLIFWYVAKLIDDDFIVHFARNKPKMVISTRESTSALSRGEVAVEFPQSDSIAADFISGGAPIKPVEMTEGVVRYPSISITMIKDAPHPNAARLFGNWILSKEGQEVWHKARSTMPVRSDVPSFLPPAANISYKKVVSLGLNEMMQVSKLQTEGTIAKAMGISK